MNYYPTLSQEFHWKIDQLKFPVSTDTGAGFSGVIANATNVAHIDPANGSIKYRGFPIEELIAKEYSYEQIAFLLVEGKCYDKHLVDYQTFRDKILNARELHVDMEGIFDVLPMQSHPTRLVRAAISAVGCFEMSMDEDISGKRHWEDVRIIGQMAIIVGNVIEKIMSRNSERCQDNSLSISELLLLQINGSSPTPKQIRTLDLLLTLYADHGLDAPTFTSMVVGSCEADPYYNIVSGLSALRGPLMGGASETILAQLLRLSDVNTAQKWTEGMLAKKWIIPGFGHKLYHRIDPRVSILKRYAEEYIETDEQKLLWDVAQAVEQTASDALAKKGVFVNLNFYSAVLFHSLGVKPSHIPCLISVGRISGVVARVREYLKENRIFRPKEEYIGIAERRHPAVIAAKNANGGLN